MATARRDRCAGSAPPPRPRRPAPLDRRGREPAAPRTTSWPHQLLELGWRQWRGELLASALPRRLVRAAAEQPGAVAEAARGDLVVHDFDYHLRLQRLPLGGAVGRPAARTARRVAGEPGRLDQPLQLFGPYRPILAGDRGGEADMMEQAGMVVEAEQQRSDQLVVAAVAEAADNAVGG